MKIKKQKVHFRLKGRFYPNVLNLLKEFGKQAKKEGWKDSEIVAVFDEAKSKDYSHLIATIEKNIVK